MGQAGSFPVLGLGLAMSEEVLLRVVLPIFVAALEAAASVYAMRKQLAQIGISIFVLPLLGFAVLLSLAPVTHLIVAFCLPIVISQLLLTATRRSLRVLGGTLLALVVISLVALPFVHDGQRVTCAWFWK
jgi:hypothetical protein